MSKIEELRFICVVKKPDIVCIVESWQCSNIDDVEVSYNIMGKGKDMVVAFYFLCLHTEVTLSSPYDLVYYKLCILIQKAYCSFGSSSRLFIYHLFSVRQDLGVHLLSNFILLEDLKV